jgi:hypothetical protein
MGESYCHNKADWTTKNWPTKLFFAGAYALIDKFSLKPGIALVARLIKTYLKQTRKDKSKQS